MSTPSPPAAPVRVCALVVTHNRAALLADALDALDAQTRRPDAIVVLDNASTDGATPDLLAARAAREARLTVVRTEANTGASGGFARGLAEVAARGPWAWVWMMDDDVRPAPDALERLLASTAAARSDTAAVTPLKIGDDGRVQATHAGAYSLARMRIVPHAPVDADAPPEASVEVGYVSFVGVLVRGDVAASVVPRADFFHGHDDVEWALRLARRGRLYLVPSAVVEHRDTAASPDLRVVRGRRVRTRGYWRAYYALRNRLLIHHAHARGVDWLFGHATAVRILARGLANTAVRYSGRDRRRRAALLLRAYADGLAGRAGRRVDPADY